jgi:hypothetical protein
MEDGMNRAAEKRRNDRGESSLDRRSLLKGAGVMVAASALPSGLEFSMRLSRQGGPMNRSLQQRTVGYMLAHEQFPITKLLALGEAAERAGFGLLATSDHFQPWQDNEGHSGEAWVTMAALGQRTKKVWIGPVVPKQCGLVVFSWSQILWKSIQRFAAVGCCQHKPYR